MTDLSAVESIYLAALECKSPDARASYLEAACPDPEIRRHVERLLAAQPRGRQLPHSAFRRQHGRLLADRGAAGHGRSARTS